MNNKRNNQISVLASASLVAILMTANIDTLAIPRGSSVGEKNHKIESENKSRRFSANDVKMIEHSEIIEIVDDKGGKHNYEMNPENKCDKDVPNLIPITQQTKRSIEELNQVKIESLITAETERRKREKEKAKLNEEQNVELIKTKKVTIKTKTELVEVNQSSSNVSSVKSKGTNVEKKIRQNLVGMRSRENHLGGKGDEEKKNKLNTKQIVGEQKKIDLGNKKEVFQAVVKDKEDNKIDINSNKEIIKKDNKKYYNTPGDSNTEQTQEII